MFPLFALPDEAVELVLGFVSDREDKRALRLTCKRSRAFVDGRVVAVEIVVAVKRDGDPLDLAELSALSPLPGTYSGSNWDTSI